MGTLDCKLYWFPKFYKNDSVQTFPPIILSFKRGNFACSNLGCTLIYHPLSYLFKSLNYSFIINIALFR